MLHDKQKSFINGIQNKHIFTPSVWELAEDIKTLSSNESSLPIELDKPPLSESINPALLKKTLMASSEIFAS